MNVKAIKTMVLETTSKQETIIPMETITFCYLSTEMLINEGSGGILEDVARQYNLNLNKYLDGKVAKWILRKLINDN